ncbi:MAG: hypothetical protein IAE84_12085 [Saprospiraceae bacterium]|jgi:hypothetical protein|nr:hypothetical protein [Saprospiraceae bacterium]HRD81254.1 hypothetical protein [Saprospiraceae bacterium]HRF41518.1 hypothetical protein [Saprospiraceae bacterium]HRK81676.1 hypothetical protein [Saprospiraceae bacterium]
MEYKVTINPYKEKEFLQLLSAWESLGVVTHYEVLSPDPCNDLLPQHETALRRPRKKVDTAWEVAEPYKDLLD